MSKVGKAPPDALELLAFVYAVVQLEGSGEIVAEKAVEAIRRKMGVGVKALARKRGRKEMTFGGESSPSTGR